MTLKRKDDVILDVLTTLRGTINIGGKDLRKYIKDKFTRLNDEEIENIISLMTDSGFIQYGDVKGGTEYYIEPNDMQFLREDEFKQNQLKIK